MLGLWFVVVMTVLCMMCAAAESKKRPPISCKNCGGLAPYRPEIKAYQCLDCQSIWGLKKGGEKR